MTPKAPAPTPPPSPATSCAGMSDQQLLSEMAADQHAAEILVALRVAGEDRVGLVDQ